MNFNFKGYAKDGARSYCQHEMGIRNIQRNIGENVKLNNMDLNKALNELSAQYLQNNIGANKAMSTDEMGTIDLLQRGEFIDTILRVSDTNRLKLQEDLKTLLFQLKIVVTDLENMEQNGGMLSQAVANGKMKQQTLDIIRAGSIKQTMIGFTDAVVENEAVTQTMTTIIGRANAAMVKINNEILTNTNQNIAGDIRKLFMKDLQLKIKGAPTTPMIGDNSGNGNGAAPGYENIVGADMINNVQLPAKTTTNGWGGENNNNWGTPNVTWGAGGNVNPQGNGGWATGSGAQGNGGWGGTPNNVAPNNGNPQGNGGWGANPTNNGNPQGNGGWGGTPNNNQQQGSGSWGANSNMNQQTNGGWGGTPNNNQQQNTGAWGDVMQYRSNITISDSSNSDTDDYSFC